MQSRFSTEHTGLVISAFILLSAAIVIVPTPFKNHVHFLKEIHIQLPFLTSSEETTDRQSHVNELILTENSATCDFLRNINSGPILVIKGTTPDLYQFPEGDPKITGRLINKAGAVLKEIVVCAGTTLSDGQLSSCQPQEIENMLKKQADIRIQPQPSPDKIPYMVVFTDLPENLENLRAEIVITAAQDDRI